MNMKKVFADDLNTAVFTTKYVLNGNSPVLYVFHYEDDGAWQFSGEEDCSEEDFRIIALEEMINIDPSILFLADLPFGYYAHRNSVESEWVIQKMENENE